MLQTLRPLFVFLTAWLAVGLAGCPASAPPQGGGASSSGTASGSTGSDDLNAPLLEVDLSEFDLDAVELPTGEATSEAVVDVPDTLDKLKAAYKWVDQPVVDPYERIKEYKATIDVPPNAQAVLKQKNDGAATNEKLLAAYGQLPASDDEIDFNAELTLRVELDAKSVNPLLQSSTVEQEVGNLTGFGLFGFDRDLTPFALADAVVSWQVSENRLVDLLVMRDDLAWSDGQPITAHDIEYSFHTIMDTEIPIPAVRQGTDELVTVKAYDDHTLAFFHKNALATNIWNINFPVIPKHIYETTIPDDKTIATSDRHVELERNPVVGGPYTIAKRTRGQEIILERRESWYMQGGKQVRQKPRFKTVRYKIIPDSNTALLALKSGDLDYMRLLPPQWQNQTDDDKFYSKNTKLYAPEWGISYIGWNTKSPLFEDARVRRAMSYALDHEVMLRDICYSLYEAGRGSYAAGAWMAPDPMPEPFTQDLDKAEELLAAAGWEDHDGDGFLDKEIDGERRKFDFSIVYGSGKKTAEQIAELLKENLDQIGITMSIRPTEFTVLQQRAREHDFDAMLAGWGTGADPFTNENLWSRKAIDEGRNFCQFGTETIDKLFFLGAREFDREKRGRIYSKIHELLWNDQPYTWLYYRATFIGMSKDLRGITFSPRDPLGYSGGFEALWKPKSK